MSKPKVFSIKKTSAPLIFLNVAFKSGSVNDPADKSGLLGVTLAMLLRGTRKLTAEEYFNKVDDLGAEIFTSKSMESAKIHAVALFDNYKKVFSLLIEVITQPRFDAEELNKIKQQYIASLKDEQSNDEAISGRRFQEYFLQGHPYGRSSSGTIESIESISIDDVRAFYARHFTRDNFVVTAYGNISKAEASDLSEKIARKLPKQSFTAEDVPSPQLGQGTRVVLLDKPDCTQTQIYIGHRGVAFHDKNYHSLSVANHVFGGSSFSAWLMSEVREKRGWSYGAYSYFRAAKQPLYFAMHTIPKNDDALPALDLMLQLYRKFRTKGIGKDEFQFARQSLINQSAFMQDTPRKRLNNKLSEILLGLPAGFYDKYQAGIKATRHAQVQKAIKQQYSDDLFILMLCPASKMQGQLNDKFGAENVQVQKIDAAVV